MRLPLPRFALAMTVLTGARVFAQQCEYPIADLRACENRTPRAEHSPKVNGCGPEWLPEGVKVPQGTAAASYEDACNGHDVCYETCNVVKADCDAAFEAAMRESCLRTYPLPLSGEDDEWDHRTTCLSRARAYADAVRTIGQSAYDDAQKVACECCAVEGEQPRTPTGKE